MCFAALEYLFVVLGNDLIDTWHTTIAQLDCIFIENLMESVLFAEMFLEEIKEGFSHICFGHQIEGWVVPYDISSSLLLFWGFLGEVHAMVETAIC